MDDDPEYALTPAVAPIVERTYDHPVPYSPGLAESVIELYTEGHTLKEIADIPGMPTYRQMLQWTIHIDEFGGQVEKARQARALFSEEAALEIARQPALQTPGDATAARLAFDAHRWIAEVSDPSRYGKRTTIQGDASRPIQIIVKSGFPDPLPHQEPPQLGPDGLIIRGAPSTGAPDLEAVAIPLPLPSPPDALAPEFTEGDNV